MVTLSLFIFVFFFCFTLFSVREKNKFPYLDVHNSSQSTLLPSCLGAENGDPALDSALPRLPPPCVFPAGCPRPELTARAPQPVWESCPGREVPVSAAWPGLCALPAPTLQRAVSPQSPPLSPPIQQKAQGLSPLTYQEPHTGKWQNLCRTSRLSDWNLCCHSSFKMA